jgi:Tfp pilus assembly protein PilF
MQRLSQRQVADMSNGRLSKTTVSDIERGRSLPGIESLLSLSRVLRVDPVEVLERIELDNMMPADLSNLSFADLLQRAKESFLAGDYRGALAVYDMLAKRLVSAPLESEQECYRLRARVEINRAVTLRRCSALKAAEAAAKRATQFAIEFPELQAQAYMVLASLHSNEGLGDLAEVAVDKAIDLAESCGSQTKGQVWNQKGDVLCRQGQFEEARQAFMQARKFLLEAKDHPHLVKVEGNLGECLFSLGRHAQSRKRFIKAIELARKHSDPAAEACWLVALGRLSNATGEFNEADRMAVAALRIARPLAHYLTIFRAEWLRHLIVRQRAPNDPDERRLTRLKKLYPRVSDQKAILAVAEFEAEVLEQQYAQEVTT